MLDHPYPASGAHRSYGVERRGTDSAILGEDAVAEEAPVALVYNGFSHAVMLATPQDLEDFALGFTLSEGIAASARELHDIDVVEHALGCEVRMALAGERFAAMRERRRALAGRTGCGLCGIESLAQLQRALPPARLADTAIHPGALERAQAELAALQPLFQLTGAVHAAAWCRRDGSVALVREDVGRHNALDKLIGALARAGQDPAHGLAVVSSRASYEMVSKCLRAGIPGLAAISAPTTLAVRIAQQGGLSLYGFCRNGSAVQYA